jgi:hypothetical protein
MQEGGAGYMNETNVTPPGASTKPPPDTSLVKLTWILIAVGWLIILVPIPFTSPIGWLVAGLGGTILAIVNLTRGVVGVGIAQLVCALIGTWVIWWIAITIFAGAVISSLAG